LVGEKGFFLDTMDAILYTHTLGATFSILVDTLENPSVHTAQGFLNGVLPKGWSPSSESLVDHGWFLISCNASYDCNGRNNHWVPAYQKNKWEIKLLKMHCKNRGG